MKNILYIFGAVFILLGLLGFVLESPLFGLFEVNTVHNLIHIISGILIFVFAGKDDSSARKFMLILGVVYALVTVLGFLSGDNGSILGVVAINNPDNYLHLVLTIAFLAIGLGKSTTSTVSTTTTTSNSDSNSTM